MAENLFTMTAVADEDGTINVTTDFDNNTPVELAVYILAQVITSCEMTAESLCEQLGVDMDEVVQHIIDVKQARNG